MVFTHVHSQAQRVTHERQAGSQWTQRERALAEPASGYKSHVVNALRAKVQAAPGSQPVVAR